MPKHDKILKNNVKNQIQMAKKFIENMKIRKKMINSIQISKDRDQLPGPSDIILNDVCITLYFVMNWK